MTLITRIERAYTPPAQVKPPLYKLCLWAVAEWFEAKIPAAWKYQLLRRWLTSELIAAGWAQPDGHGDEGRLAKQIDPGLRVNVADHEAVGRHFKEFPLRTIDGRTQTTPNP